MWGGIHYGNEIHRHIHYIHIYIYIYTLSCIYSKKWKHYTELNVFRINKIDTWMSFWTLTKSRHLSKVLLLTLNMPLPAGFCFSQSFWSTFNKIFFSWIPLLFQKKIRYGLSTMCFFKVYFKKGTLRTYQHIKHHQNFYKEMHEQVLV